MRKEVILTLVLLLFLLPLISSSSIDSEIQKITHYAEEYETGNINYVQLIVYMSSARARMNEILGATGKEQGGILKEEQLRPVLGEPDEKTRWVWVEREEREKRIDRELPVWRKIIFDGKKIQIRLNAWPTLFRKKGGEEFIIYRLHFETDFKKPSEELNIEGKIQRIKELAMEFNSDPSISKADALARESVNAERTFETYFRQNSKMCVDVMNDVFGAENMRETQKLFVQEISLYAGENFEAVGRLEMCEECEWNWVNFNVWIEGRGPGFKPVEEKMEEPDFEKQFEGLDSSYFEAEIGRLLSELITMLETGDIRGAQRLNQRFWALNEAWNKAANDIWEEVDKMFKRDWESMTDQERETFHRNYGWLEEEQKRREFEKNLRRQNFERRKNFYMNLFASFEKKEYYFEQVEYEKRLIEEFREKGKEMCDNGEDDNDNGQVDCEEDQCGGKICGRGTAMVTVGNVTKEAVVDLYCISGECKAREEITPGQVAVCGNHICENNESITNCLEDCSICPDHPAIECPEGGKVIFPGEDENACPLPPICVEGEETCKTNIDCEQPLCGNVECVYEHEADESGKCEIVELKICKEPDCVDGEKKIEECNDGEKLVIEICKEGMWHY